MEKLGALSMSSDIFEKSNIGLWAFELDEGCEPRMYANKTMLKLLGLDRQISPEETYHAWYDHIDPEHYDEVAESVERMTAGVHAEVQYPWHHPDGSTWIVRCGGIRNFEYRKGIRIEGTHQNVTDVAHFQKAVLGTIALDKDILTKANIGLWAFELDEGCEPRMYVNEAMLKLIGLDRQISPEDTYHAWYDHIDPEHYDEVAESVEKMTAGIHAEVQYPWRHPDGKTVWIVRCGGVRNFAYTKGIRIEGTHQNVTDLIHFEKETIEKLSTVVEAMSEDYELLMHADLENDTIEPYRISGNFADLIPDWVPGSNYTDMVKAFTEKYVIPDDREQLLMDADPKQIAKKVKNGKPYIFYARAFFDGRDQWLQAKCVHHRAHGDKNCAIIGIQNSDEALRRSMMGRAVIEALGADFDLVTYIDPKTNEEIIYRTNNVPEVIAPHWDKVNSYDERIALINRHFVHPDDREMFARKTSLARLKSKLQNDPVYYFNFRGYYKEYTYYYQAKYVLVVINGNENIVTGFRSVDELTRQQMAYQDELSEARKKAEAASRAKSIFLFNMSHDIRTPMNAILGYADLMLKHINDSKFVSDSARKIKSSGEYLLSLINDVLDMARIESDKTEIDEGIYDIKERAYILCDVFEESMQKKNLTFITDFHDMTNTVVWYDSLKLRQIMLNLLSNAVKYTPAGGTITHTMRQLDCGKPGYAQLEISVRDTGIGMKKEFVDHIFEPFSRSDDSITKETQGTGLGMPIVRKLIELMGGTISIESEPDKGTDIIVTLEVRLASEEDLLRLESQKEPGIDPEILRGVKILLVDDNELNREIAQEILEDEGCIVVDIAENGVIALEKIRASSPGDFDIVLMDIQMPVMDGYEATRQIRALENKRLAGIPVIAMTANAFEEDRQNALDAGMNEHLTKPIEIDKLKSVLAGFIK